MFYLFTKYKHKKMRGKMEENPSEEDENEFIDDLDLDA